MPLAPRAKQVNRAMDNRFGTTGPLPAREPLRWPQPTYLGGWNSGGKRHNRRPQAKPLRATILAAATLATLSRQTWGLRLITRCFTETGMDGKKMPDKSRVYSTRS